MNSAFKAGEGTGQCSPSTAAKVGVPGGRPSLGLELHRVCEPTGALVRSWAQGMAVGMERVLSPKKGM